MTGSEQVRESIGRGLREQYRVGREIGRGGMATVYLAHDLKHDRPVALKVLHPDYSAAIGAERFAREIMLVARLQHPHILPLYDSGSTDGLLYFVMPMVEGGSLRDRLDADHTLGLAETVGIIRQVADALGYAHEHGVVHRDVKPENLLVAHGQALLADFGVARVNAAIETRRETLTALGSTLGTPAYMSPEQACGDEVIDGRSDQYSLACVCYEMLAGVPPFVAHNTMALISKHITILAPQLTGAREMLPPGVAKAVAQALSKDPDERFANIRDFALALEAAMVELRARTTSDERLLARQKNNDTRRKVIVLDFTNISGSADIDWLSSGIAETIGVDLQRIHGIRVVGADAMARKRMLAGAPMGPVTLENALEIGRVAGAQWVVWGGFQRAGERIRLTAHFGDTNSRESVSAEKIDGALDDVFALQDRIVTSLASVLQIRLTHSELEGIARPETTQLTAYEHYAKGKRAFQQFGRESMRQAGEHFGAAVQIDPGYALAWAGLGSLLMPKYIAFGRQEDLDQGVAALQRAMTLDPSLGEPYPYLAYMYLRQGKYNEAVTTARKAIEHDPGGPMAWFILGTILSMRAVGTETPADFARAIPPLLRARALNAAFHPPAMSAAAVYILRGQYSHAAPLLDEAMVVERAGQGLLFIGAAVQRASLFLNSDEPDRARDLLAWALERYPAMDHVYSEIMTAYARVVEGGVEERAGNLDAAEHAFAAAIELADIHSHRVGIGAHWVRARCGIARVRACRGDIVGAGHELEAALTLFQDRNRFVWAQLFGATDADVWYDIAAAHATLGDDDAAMDALEHAISRCWSDANQIRFDPAFAALRERPQLQELVLRAQSKVMLPPPIGAGGLPAM
jgi:serine/threonine protein kinase/tetratricopeptide (TPR) repeat protein